MIVEMHSFQEFLPGHQDFVSGRPMSFVSIYNSFEWLEFKIFAGKYLPPFHENPYSKMFLTITFLFVNLFSKFLLYMLRQT